MSSIKNLCFSHQIFGVRIFIREETFERGAGFDCFCHLLVLSTRHKSLDVVDSTMTDRDGMEHRDEQGQGGGALRWSGTWGWSIMINKDKGMEHRDEQGHGDGAMWWTRTRGWSVMMNRDKGMEHRDEKGYGDGALWWKKGMKLTMRLTRKESSFHQRTSSSPELGRKGSKYKIDIREIDKHNEDQTTKKTETHEISNLITTRSKFVELMSPAS